MFRKGRSLCCGVRACDVRPDIRVKRVRRKLSLVKADQELRKDWVQMTDPLDLGPLFRGKK